MKLADSQPIVHIYCDGSHDSATHAGGWGAVLLSAQHRKEIAGYATAEGSTSLELIAIIESLKCLKTACSVTVFTDSQSLSDVAQGVSASEKNQSLWAEYFALAERHQISVLWVRGHRGEKENERAHVLAFAAMKRQRWQHRRKLNRK